MSKKSTSNSDTFFPLTSWFSSYFFSSLPTKRRGQTWRKTHRKMTSQFRLKCIHVKTNLRSFHFTGKLFLRASDAFIERNGASFPIIDIFHCESFFQCLKKTCLRAGPQCLFPIRVFLVACTPLCPSVGRLIGHTLLFLWFLFFDLTAPTQKVWWPQIWPLPTRTRLR